MPLPAWRRDVQRASGIQLDARREDVHVNATVVVAMQDGHVGVLIGPQTWEGDTLKIVEHRVDFGVGRCITRRPRDDARRVSMLRR